MKLHLEIPDEKVEKGIREVAEKNQWSITKVGKVAIKFYLKAKKIIKE